MDPVLGWEVVEREQLLQVVGDLRRGLGELRPVRVLERLGRFAGVVLVLNRGEVAGAKRSRICLSRDSLLYNQSVP